MSTFACSGLSCHNRVSESGQFCGSCWPDDGFKEWRMLPNTITDHFKIAIEAGNELEARRIADAEFQGLTPEDLKRLDESDPIGYKPESKSLQFQILDSAYKLALGTAEEQKEALATVLHLSNVLNQEQTNQERT